VGGPENEVKMRSQHKNESKTKLSLPMVPKFYTGLE